MALCRLMNEFQSEFNATLHVGQRLCFITRGKELQIAARNAFALMRTRVGRLKEQAIANEYEDAANASLVLRKWLRHSFFVCTQFKRKLHRWKWSKAILV